VNLAFASKLKQPCREQLEELLFFNPRQHLVREGIVHALLKFGHPRLVETPEGLSVRVGDQQAQTLFALDLDRDPDLPVGVVVFLRTQPEEIAIMHVAVDPDYALHGSEAGLGLGVVLIEKVQEIAARIVGVERIVFFYRQEVVIRVRAKT
jgi:ribosomal protein S18 acetylase RimI-like enzyme